MIQETRDLNAALWDISYQWYKSGYQAISSHWLLHAHATGLSFHGLLLHRKDGVFSCLFRTGADGFAFEDIIKCVKQVDHAISMGVAPIDSRACCLLAVRRDCVCSFSYECPWHGSKCIGTHD